MRKDKKTFTFLNNKKRIVLNFGILLLAIAVGMARLAWVQLINDDFYRSEALDQQTYDVSISAKRGDITDRNGNILATSVTSYTLICYPSEILDYYSNDEIEEISKELEELTYMDSSLIYEKLVQEVSSDEESVDIINYLTSTQINKIFSIKISEHKIRGFDYYSEYTRYYPYGDLASQLLGSVTMDKTGRSGLELQYDQYLSGINGRWVKLTDVNGNELESSDSAYYDAQNGLNVVTTIDTTIQYYAEEVIRDANEACSCNRLMCLIMDPNTGEILASVVSDGFNPNEPYVPSNTEDAAYLDTLSGQEWVNTLSRLWRNPIVSDTYEFGSIVKLFFASMAIEEKIMSDTDTLYCGGTYDIDGDVITCSEGEVHGYETIKESIAHSCNIALTQIAFRLGKTRVYNYLRNFGLMDTTGIDYPAEASPQVKNQNGLANIDLSNMSFGQGIALTPLEYLTAACAIVNGGEVITPRYVSKLVDDDGNTVVSYDKNVVRKVISEETSAEMRDILLYSATNGTSAGRASVLGYQVGGKTGTAEKYVNGSYSEQVLSYVAFAPMDDPQIAILVVMDEPSTTSFAASVLTPIVKDILEQVLPYMGITPNYTESELQYINSDKISVPNVIEKSYEEAKEILENKGFLVEVADSEDENDFVIKAQYPISGTSAYKGSTVYLYRG